MREEYVGRELIRVGDRRVLISQDAIAEIGREIFRSPEDRLPSGAKFCFAPYL